MSRNSGNYFDRPADGMPENPASIRQGLPVPGFDNFHGNFFDLLGIMAIMIDRRGIIRRFNRKAEDLVGYSKDEAIGRDWCSLMIPEQERGRAREQLTGALQPGVGHRTLFSPVTARDGSRLPVCWSLSTVLDDRGKVFGLFCMGFVPAGPDAPCREVRRQMEEYCSTVGNMTHDLLNHSQVVMGYLEMAVERTGDNRELHCMLDRAAKSMAKCGSIAVNVHKLSNSQLK
jgi:PAS domain S-box-containing protein